MPRFGEGTPFGSTDFSEEDAWAEQMEAEAAAEVIDLTATGGLCAIYGDRIGRDEIEEGMLSKPVGARPDQVVDEVGGLHTNWTHGAWLVDRCIMVDF